MSENEVEKLKKSLDKSKVYSVITAVIVLVRNIVDIFFK